MKKIGVVGAGVMGIGVAQNLAQVGYEVALVDISELILEKAKNNINNNIRFQSLMARSKEVINSNQVIDRILFTTDYEQLRDVDYLIENVTEKWEIKKDVYKKIDQICQEHCIFAVNTSVISITKIASLTKRPSKVIGIHFMNPVPLKPVVEVIKGYHTSEESIEQTKNFLATMGKEGIIVNDYPGFVSNRVLMLTINEAIFEIHEGVAEAEDIDRIFKQCFGHKMGPLETADLIGLDTILYSIEGLYESYSDSKFRPCPLLVKMVHAGMHGVKSGKGFYNYSTY